MPTVNEDLPMRRIYVKSGGEKRYNMKNNSGSVRIKKMTFVALFCALAFIVSVIFPLKVMFLTLDFKDAITAICGMAFGPVSGLAAAIVVPFIELMTSDTGIYGLIMNILSSVTFVGISSLIYKHKKTIHGAVLGLAVAVPATVAVMICANLLITPLYMPGADVKTVIGLIPTVLLPFNLIKSTLNAGFVMLLYKPISGVLKRSGALGRLGEGGADKEQAVTVNKKRSAAVAIISLALVVAAFTVLFLIFDVSF